MALATKLWDPAEFLDSDEAVAAYIAGALDDGDPALVAAALGDARHVADRQRDRDVPRKPVQGAQREGKSRVRNCPAGDEGSRLEARREAGLSSCPPTQPPARHRTAQRSTVPSEVAAAAQSPSAAAALRRARTFCCRLPASPLSSGCGSSPSRCGG